MPTAIEARGLTKAFGLRRAVDAVDLDVPAGSCFGFIGPNGAGKTTLIRLLLGLARPDSGTIQIAGINVTRDPRAALAKVGAIVEEPRFHTHLTGVENLRTHAALLGLGAKAGVPSLLRRVGLAGRGGEKVKGYSLGMRQRLGVARALLGDPEILILDEPTNGLDAQGMVDFRELVRGMVEQEGRTVFLSSHLLDEMEKVCDEVAIVDHGRVATQASVQSFLDAGTRTVLLDCDDPVRAQGILAELALVTDVVQDPDGKLRITGGDDRAATIELVRLLVTSGVGVAELRVEGQSLEQRFLDLTASQTPRARREAAQ